MRRDIQGLRALAVIAVVLFHAQFPIWTRGYLGVDIFFVISGYLIIGMLYREFDSSGRINFPKFLARRARRLVPAASLVLLSVVVATTVLMPGLSGRRVYADIGFASAYVANLHFGFTATDYWATHATSPVLHFWSLGVEEQFYVMFPLLLLGLSLLHLKKGAAAKLLTFVLCLASALSLLFMLHLHTSSPDWAFYNPLSRAWEFAFGGLAALASGYLALRFKQSAHHRIVGLFSLVLFVPLLLSMSATFSPWRKGTTEIVAVVLLTSVLLLVGSIQGDSRVSLASWSGPRPVQWLGNISYSTYLWHWPILFFGDLLWKDSGASGGRADDLFHVGCIALTLVLAHATYKWVENPLRHMPALVSSNRRSMLLALAMSLTVIATAQGAQRFAPVRLATAPIEDLANVPRIADRNPSEISDIISRFTPNLVPTDRNAVSAEQVDRALNDFPQTNVDGCFIEGVQSTKFKPCIYGQGPTLIALVGSSHTNQMFSPIKTVASKLESRLLVHTRSGCTLADVTYTINGSIWKACNSWKSAVMQDLLRARPELVVMVPRFQTVVDPSTGKEASQSRQVGLFIQGVERTSRQLTAHGIKVLLIGDTPVLKHDPLDCLSSHVVHACDQSIARALPASTNELMQLAPEAGVVRADITQAICTDAVCPAVRSGQIVWRDRDHLTDSYAQLLTGMLQGLVKETLQAP